MGSAQDDTYHGAEGDQPDEGVWWEEAEADDDCLAESFQIIDVNTRIDHEEEDWGCGGRAGERVFDRGVFWKKFGRKICVGYILVMWRERVARQTEWADPEFATDVDLARARE